MQRFLDEICPLKTIFSKNPATPWMNSEIKNIIAERKIAYDNWRRNRKEVTGDALYDIYHQLDKKVKYTIRRSKKESFIEKYNNAQTNQHK